MGAFDATTKYLIERHAADFLALAGIAVGRRPVRVVDAELTTITSVPDKIVRIGGGSGHRSGSAVHVEFQTVRDAGLDERVLAYNVLARRRHRVPVLSVVFLLRPAAAPPAVRGAVRWAGATGSPLSFDYQLVRVWQLSPAALLAGGLGTLPLAPVSGVRLADAAAVIAAMQDRIDRETDPQTAGEMWTATGILMGLRYNRAVIGGLLAGVRHMRESVFYREIVNEGRVEGRAEGRVEEAQHLLARQGAHKFGPPGPGVTDRIRSVTDLDELDRLSVRLLDVTGWAELLGE